MSAPTMYGGWRERRGFGVGSLSGPQTTLALLCVVILLGIAVVMPGLMVAVAPPVLLVGVMFGLPVRGETPAGMIARHAGWMFAERRGRHRYSGRGNDLLPGGLACLNIVEVADGSVDLAAVWDERAGTLTAVVPLEPIGPELVDEHEVGQWTSSWGDWLAHLGYLKMLRQVVVTVHSGPMLQAGDQPDGEPSDVAAQVLAELRVQGAARYARARTVMSMTVACPGGDLEAGCAELRDVLAAAEGLARCGVCVLPPMDAAAVAAWVRAAFDPDAATDGVRAAWLDARPVAMQEQWDRVRHDGWVSTGFFWDECPGQGLPPAVLSRLLGPSQYHKRVSLVFEPVPADRAAREVDRQAEAAQFRRQYRLRLGRDETARDAADLQRAQQTAREQAAGAGLVDVSLYAVLTAPKDAALETCVADLTSRAGEARLRLRRGYGSQVAIFEVGLAVGRVPGSRR